MEICPALDNENIGSYKEAANALLTATVGLIRSSNNDVDKLVSIVMSGKYNKILAESSVVLDAKLTDVCIGAISYDLLVGIGCSTIAFPTKIGPVLARNLDWAPTGLITDASCVIENMTSIRAGFVGEAGIVTALSKNGFGVALNAVDGELNPVGEPVMLFLRHLVDTARSYDHAVQMVNEADLMSSALITLVGTKNDERVCMECDGDVIAPRFADGDKPLVATNHFRLLRTPIECPRYNSLRDAVITDDVLEHLQRVQQDITAQHVCMQPSIRYLRLYKPRLK